MQRYNCSCSGLDIDFLTVIICENRNLIEVISMLRSWRYLVSLLAAGAVVLAGLMFSVGPAQIYDPELGVVFAASGYLREGPLAWLWGQRLRSMPVERRILRWEIRPERRVSTTAYCGHHMASCASFMLVHR
jgi:hypothetical protein